MGTFVLITTEKGSIFRMAKQRVLAGHHHSRRVNGDNSSPQGLRLAPGPASADFHSGAARTAKPKSTRWLQALLPYCGRPTLSAWPSEHSGAARVLCLPGSQRERWDTEGRRGRPRQRARCWLPCSGSGMCELVECLPPPHLIWKEASRRKPETQTAAYKREPSPSPQPFSPSTFSTQLLPGHGNAGLADSTTAFQEEPARNPRSLGTHVAHSTSTVEQIWLPSLPREKTPSTKGKRDHEVRAGWLVIN